MCPSSLSLRQVLAHSSQDLLPELGALDVAHMARIRELNPAHVRYVLEEGRDGYIWRGVKLAIVDERRHVDLVQARDGGPIPEGPTTTQR